jgi:tRNA 2-thiouridine synthesizing protein D
MENIAMIVRKAPYGDISAAEAVRHALGAAADDLKTSLILLDSGVLLAKKGQDVGSTGFTNLGSTLMACIEMGAEVYADRESLTDCFLDPADLVEGIKVVEAAEIARLIKEAKTTFIF